MYKILILFIVLNLLSLIPNKLVNIPIKEPLPDNFEYIYNALIKYNPHLDSCTAIQIVTVANFYELTSPELIDWVIGQILLESGANQYYGPQYKQLHGKLVKSEAGAIGICQIMPYTNLNMFKKYVTLKDKIDFVILGSSKFPNTHLESKEWLSIEANNIIMWGFIMRQELDKNPIQLAMISYNSGPKGLQNYLGAGKHPDNHPYIKGIREKLTIVEL